MPTLPPRLRTALLLVVGLLAGVVLSLLVYAFSIRTPVESVAVDRAVPRPGAESFLETMGLHTDTRFAAGHRVEILPDGDALFPRLWADLRGARRSVTVQLYFCAPGRLADSLAAALERPARAGVPVLFLYDGFGCDPLGDDYFQRLRDAGVGVRAFRPVRWWSLHRAQQRSHARIVVIDGVVGYTGGFGIDDRWSAAGAEGEPGWRETSVRFTGPAVRALQAAFAEGWAEAAGQLLVGERFFPRTPYRDDDARLAATAGSATGDSVSAGSITAGSAIPDSAIADSAIAGSDTGVESSVVAGLFHSTPDAGSTTAERLLALTIAGAERTLYVANAYFVPDDDFRRLLIDAADRGVDVRVLAPDEGTDVPVVRYAARAHYAELLEGGVRLYEYQPTMMHAKTFVVDGVWSSIGSMNFDNRSLAVNEETTLLVLDPGLGARMDRLFLDDLERARELTLDTFRRRGLWQRVRERLAVLSSRIL